MSWGWNRLPFLFPLVLFLPNSVLATVHPARPDRRAIPSSRATESPDFLAASGDTVWVNVHATPQCPGDPRHGGETTGGPDLLETWCFEGGPGDSTSTGPGGRVYTFRSYDRRPMRDDRDSLYWRATTFQSLDGGADRSMWCGGFNNACGEWLVTTGGYANRWQQILQLDLGPFAVTRGCSIQFRSRYVMECNYDYAYLEYWSFRRNEWRAVDRFNGRSGCTVFPAAYYCFGDWNNYSTTTKCPPLPWGGVTSYPADWRGSGAAARDFSQYPYRGTSGDDYVVIRGDSISATPASTPIRLRWRVSTDNYLSSADGNTLVRGFWLDDVIVKGDASAFGENFNALAEGSVPGAPWSTPNLDPIYDGWAIRYDLDPPFEGWFAPSPGDSGFPYSCTVNASWQWSIAPAPGAIPPPSPTAHLPGYQILLQSPSIPLGYADEEGGPFTHPGVFFQYDGFLDYRCETCDFPLLWVRVHKGTGWCDWSSTAWWFECPSGQSFDTRWDLTPWSDQPGADSIQVAWGSQDSGRPGDWCWDPDLPPHLDTQDVVDNVSFGFVDAHATAFTPGFYVPGTGLFQDTFNLHTCMHSSVVSNSEIPTPNERYVLQDRTESLAVRVLDEDGLAAGSVLLRYSYDGFATEATGSPIAMNLSDPYYEPGIGGDWTGAICDTPWTPGTEISYFLEATDALGNKSWWPRNAEPGSIPRGFHTVEVLPTPGARILLVDDFGGDPPDYHPCRSDTISRKSEDFYRTALEGLGYPFMEAGGYDLYDVGSGFSWSIHEPWGFWTAHPDSITAGERTYDLVIWNTGTRESQTVQDTTQSYLKEFVFSGGRLLLLGDHVVEDLSSAWTVTDPDFLPGILGAETASPAYHANPFLDPDRQPKIAGAFPDATFPAGDSLHLYVGCDEIHYQTEKITLATTAPSWAYPQPYLLYDDVAAPYDSLAGIYNWVTAGADTGLVVFLPFGLETIVDATTSSCAGPPSGTFRGRHELLKNVLALFGAPVRTDVASNGSSPLPPAAALFPIRPNPLRIAGDPAASAAIRFRLERASEVSVTVYDVRGRGVATLARGPHAAGDHELRWDGRNSDGSRLSAGIYFVKLEAPAVRAVEKVTLLP